MSEPRVIDQPQPGFYFTKLVKNGPRVPARIWIEAERHGPRDDAGKYLVREVIRCKVGDDLIDAMQAWPSLRPITEAEWKYLDAAREWARDYAPHLPEARPREAINLDQQPPLF